MYASLARQIAAIDNAQSASPIISELKDKLEERVPSEDELLALFPELVYTNTVSKQRALIKYVLGRLAREQGHVYAADMDDLTIEHLVPQSAIGSDGWTDTLVGQAGNLILVTKTTNGKLENKSFSDKKLILKANRSADLIPDYFLSAKELTPELVRRRTADLAKVAYRLDIPPLDRCDVMAVKRKWNFSIYPNALINWESLMHLAS